jgi:heptosyltransferase-2
VFDLPGTAALLKRARALVSGDTGVMHLSTAVGVPVVALYGPTVEHFGFFPYHAKAAILQREIGCRPCSAHGGPACPLTHHRCMQDLLPDQVLEALRKLPR